MAAEVPLHLVDAGQQRENSAVDCLLNIASYTQERWFHSLGIHPTHHGCLTRPVLKGVHPRLESVEVDIVFGNVGLLGWPPAVDQLVALEAKAWKKTWEDLQPWNQGQNPKTEL